MSMLAIKRAVEPSAARASWFRGFRGMVFCAGPLFVGIATDQIYFGSMITLGAYLTCFADDRVGAFATRVRTMSMCVLMCAASVAIRGFAAPHGVLGPILVVLWTFAWGVVSVAGSSVSIIGSMAATAILISIESFNGTQHFLCRWTRLGRRLARHRCNRVVLAICQGSTS